jgi:hypothetical protein
MGEGSANREQLKGHVAVTASEPKHCVAETLVCEFEFPKRKQARLPLLETVEQFTDV